MLSFSLLASRDVPWLILPIFLTLAASILYSPGKRSCQIPFSVNFLNRIVLSCILCKEWDLGLPVIQPLHIEGVALAEKACSIRFLAPKGVEETGAVHLKLDLNELSETSYFKEKGERKKEIWGAEDRVDGLKMSGVSRVCVDCQATKTPLWRSGPRGPKSLCNACGIRYRKRRKAAALGFQKEDKEKQGRRKHVGVPLKFKILRNEEEEAAVLLMALSCGSVYA